MLIIPPASMSRWESVHVDDKPHRRHINYDQTLPLDKPIYRYMQATHLLQFLRTGEFYFSSVDSWPDPFEQWWHRILFNSDSPLSDARAFATCWTWRSRDEPFWRLYESRCDHRDAENRSLPKAAPPVRIKSTLRQIIDALSISIRNFETKVFMAPVGYTTTAELLRYRSSLTTEPAEIAREAAHALTYKRLSFRFEKEVRVIWVDQVLGGGSRLVPLAPTSVIEEIMIGPVLEADRARATQLKRELQDAGFQGRIRRSLMYRPPPLS